MYIPERLKKGGLIGVCAPCYSMPPEARNGAAQLEAMGYRVRFAPNAFSVSDGWAGTLAERVADFNGLIADPEVDMILFGGGEVGNELLPCLDYEGLRRAPKIVRGFSDGTTILNAITSRCGLVTYYGHALRMFAPLSDENRLDFIAAHVEPTARVTRTTDWKVLRPGTAHGRLAGGYLVNFAVMTGGAYLDPGDEPLLLVLEDHEMFSPPCVLSKWFSHLEQAGVLARTSGLVFGHYAKEPNADVERVLARVGERYGIPVVKNDDFGHGDRCATFPLGLTATLDTACGFVVCDEPMSR